MEIRGPILFLNNFQYRDDGSTINLIKTDFNAAKYHMKLDRMSENKQERLFENPQTFSFQHGQIFNHWPHSS